MTMHLSLTLKSTILLVAVTVSAGLSTTAFARGGSLNDVNRIRRAEGQMATSLAGKTYSRFRMNGMASYGLRQDLALDRTPNISTHRVAGSASLSILDSTALDNDSADELLTLTLMAAGQYKTVGQEVQGNVHGGPIESADVDAVASRTLDLKDLWGAESALDLSIGSTFPTSEASQYERVVAVPYTSADWALSFRGGAYKIVQSVSGEYVMNTYDHSPVTREFNQDTSAGYSVTASARLGAGFRFTAGGSARLVHYLDDSVTSALGNFQVLSWTRGFATVSLRHSNGARAEDHQTTLWFINEYTRIVSLGISVRF